MNLHLTSIDPALDRLIRQTPEGMMFWAGTCADPAATCGGCVHYGYESVVRHKNTGDALRTSKHPHSCALFQQYTKRHGNPLPKNTRACKYFEAR